MVGRFYIIKECPHGQKSYKSIQMNTMKKIKGFPDYMMDEEGNVHSFVQQGKDHVMKLSKAPYQGGKALFLNMRDANGDRRKISYYRLKYAVDNGICYDNIPAEYHIMPLQRGVRVVTTTEQMAQSMMKVRKRRQNKDYKLWVIDTRIHELEILRRAYTNGCDYREAVGYIEQNKKMLCRHFCKKYNVNPLRVDDIYATALERLIERIKASDGLITTLVVQMMSLMQKVRKEEKQYTCFSEKGMQVLQSLRDNK